MQIEFFHTHISSNAQKNVLELLNSTLLSEGKVVQDFESQLESQLQINHVVTVNSGTTALHLALLLAGIKDGDEVIIPSQTFIATGLAVLMVKATPIFADINYATGNICTADIRAKITHKTKAIIPVHWAGYPCDMDEICSIAKEFNLKIIEDAAHALGAWYKNKPIGTISDFTCFSFQAIKHITTGDGGAVVCKSKESYDEARKLRWFGIDRANSPMSIIGEREYDLDRIGYKYHLNNYAAALGNANLEDLNFILSARTNIAKRYTSAFSSFPGIELLDYKVENKCAWWLYTFKVEQREKFIRKLQSKGIPASVVHIGIHKNKIFDNKFVLKSQNLFDQNQISIPLHSGLTDEMVDHVIKTIKEGW